MFYPRRAFGSEVYQAARVKIRILRLLFRATARGRVGKIDDRNTETAIQRDSDKEEGPQCFAES